MRESKFRPFVRAWRGVAPGGHAEERATSSRRRHRTPVITFILLVLPSVFLLLLIDGYPLAYGALQSLHNGSLLNSGDFVGMQQYISVLTSSDFWNAAGFTGVYTLVGVFGSWLFGLGLALLLRTKVPAAGIMKMLLLLPWITPIVVSSMAWNWLVATPSSPVPELAHALGLGSLLFLANPQLAVFTVCVFKIWASFPFMMLMSSSALSGIDESLYEAAKLDGASGWQTLSQVTLPLIKRSTYISWILMAIFCVNDFSIVFLLTGGGPVSATTTLVVLAYRMVFQDFQTGPGVAVAFLMTFALVIVSAILYQQIKKVDSA